MSWWPDVFRRRPPPTGVNTIAIPDDLVALLTADGVALSTAAEAALRAHLGEQPTSEAETTGGRAPFFWLRREAGPGTDLEQPLRDRIIERRGGEDGR